jgi:cbb3-type cytochrome oxidase maturation protein
MEILYLLIPIAIALLALIVALFFWAVKSGQFEDLDSPAWRILMDDEPPPGSGSNNAPGRGADEEPEQR